MCKQQAPEGVRGSYLECPAADARPQRNAALAQALDDARQDHIYAYMVAATAGISATLLTHIVTGRRKPRPEVASAVADALGAEVSDLFPHLER
jgi:hypothetical protein